MERIPLWTGAPPVPGAPHTHAELVALMRDDPIYESRLAEWFDSGVAGGWIDGAAETPDLELYPLPPRRDGGRRPCVLVFPGGGNVCRVDGVGVTTGVYFRVHIQIGDAVDPPHSLPISSSDDAPCAGEDREGPPIARWLNSLGFVAAVVHYRVQVTNHFSPPPHRREIECFSIDDGRCRATSITGLLSLRDPPKRTPSRTNKKKQHRYPTSLLDGQRAVALARARADGWGVDVRRVGVLGFSSGGHVAALVAAHAPLAAAALDGGGGGGGSDDGGRSCVPDGVLLGRWRSSRLYPVP